MIFRFSLRILILLLLTSCAGGHQVRLKSTLTQSNCNQQKAYRLSSQDIPKPIHELVLDTSLTSRFSFNSLNVANAIGLVDLLNDFVKSKKQYQLDPTLANRFATMELTETINHRIDIASLEISAISSELDCEEERTDQIATYLRHKEDDSETKLTVGAIVVGATGAILSGLVLNKGNASEYIGIGAGITEATLGILILTNKRKVELQHPRNVLRTIWEGQDEAGIFPPSVWYYLTYDNPAEPDMPPLRQQIIEKWESFGQIDRRKTSSKKKQLQMYFDDGGKYSAEELRNRANMLDQLESHVNLMKQALRNLAIELEDLKANK
ncbi:hypothetical protein ACMA1I_17510 [Pontibacter sp. 13R65]|uniref:hypothetical protein n=1 Tax=Pontibacter sp. 13R65 TaxID=3127458 RepID=UPI00301D4047